MKYMLAQKIQMSQIFDETGAALPVTVLSAGPMTVTQIKTIEKDNYESVQLGYGEKKEKSLSKPVRGHLKDLGNFRWIREAKLVGGEHKRGDKIDISIFSEGEKVKVSSLSKGKGFQGGVKRHGFHGGPRTHGQKHSEREVGSIGSTGQQRVDKGKKMPGRMGGTRVTVKNLKIIKIDTEKNLLYLKGALPGARGGLVEIYQ